MSKNMVELEKPQMAMQYGACALHAHTDKCVILIAFPRQQRFAKAPQCYVIRTLAVLFLPLFCCYIIMPLFSLPLLRYVPYYHSPRNVTSLYLVLIFIYVVISYWFTYTSLCLVLICIYVDISHIDLHIRRYISYWLSYTSLYLV